MKKLLLLLGFIGVVSLGSASAQAVWGIRGGVCYPTISAEGQSIDGVAGLELGPVVYYSIGESTYINSGAMFSMKNFEFGGSDKMSLYFIEIPLYFGYALTAGNLSLYGQAGPFAGIKLAESLGDDDGGEDGGDIVKSFNAGLGIVAGINIQKFKIELGYQQGLTNISNFDGDGSVTLGSLFLGVSYVF